MAEQVKVWKTDDGSFFGSKEKAFEHELKEGVHSWLRSHMKDVIMVNKMEQATDIMCDSSEDLYIILRMYLEEKGFAID